jgi:Acidic fibroblast growth factor binding (FIBP)
VLRETEIRFSTHKIKGRYRVLLIENKDRDGDTYEHTRLDYIIKGEEQLHKMSAFCFSPEIIDFHILQLWLKGLTVSQATSLREDADPVLRDVLEIDTADHFRLFEELQPSLEEPHTSLCLLSIAPSVRAAMADSFYSFDDVVIREFLGRKFTSRARKDLDEVSDITGVPRRSCLRQFDNLKR